MKFRPKRKLIIIDPACGTYHFYNTLRYVWNKIDEKGKIIDEWSINQIENEKNEVAKKNISGMDDDVFLTKVR